MPRTLPRFEYLTPHSLDEAVALLERYQDKARILAGGTDLLRDMKCRRVLPQYLVSLKAIPGLDQIELTTQGGLNVGPGVSTATIRDSALVGEKFTALAEAAENFATPQVQNMATLAGNLATAACYADFASPLIALGATLKLLGPRGERILPVENFFTSAFKPALGRGEVIAQVSLPPPSPTTVSTYIKYTLPGAIGYSFVGVAIALDIKDGKCQQARIGLVASSHCWLRGECFYQCPFPARASEAEAILQGMKVEKAVIEEAAHTAAREAHPLVDTDYTRHIIQVYTQRAILRCWQKAKGGQP